MKSLTYIVILISAGIISGVTTSSDKRFSDGLVIDQPGGIAINIPMAGTNAIQIAQAGIDGVQVQSAGRDGVRVSNAAGYGILAKGTTGAGYFDGKVEVNGEITSSSLGVNTTPSPSTKLSVKGNTSFGGNMLLTSLSALPSAGSNILEVEFDSFTDPVADAWTTYSSRRWKSNIRTFTHAVEKVQQLRGVTFNWKKNGKHDFGLIAEEVGEVFPEIVAYESNGIDAKSVDYARLVALLIEAVKEQQTEIDLLKQNMLGPGIDQTGIDE